MDSRRVQFSVFCFFVFINRLFIFVQGKQNVLLDMKASGGDLGWLPSPTEEGWEVVQTVINGSLLYTYSVCNVANDGDQDNWLRTTFIQRRADVSRVSVELQFVVRDCGTFDGNLPSCRETFGLYLAESDVDVGTSFRKANFKKVATIAPDEVTANRGGGKAAVRVNIETKTVGQLSRRGFYLAFQDSGACVALVSVRVFYTVCPAAVQGLAAFPEKVAAGALTEVEGSCVENSVLAAQVTVPRMYCTSEGDWVVPVGQCQCRAGYQPVGDACKACEAGFFKTVVSNAPCEPCPANTQSSKPGALLCQCLEGFFRAPTDLLSAPCSAPPGPPRDVVATSMSSSRLQLSWRAPRNTGGRSDVTYGVSCEQCEGGVCGACGERVHFEPSAAGLRDTIVMVSELESHLNYTFTVEAFNGVSRYGQQRATSNISTVLHNTDPPMVTSIRLDDYGPTSLSLSWTLDRRVHPQSTHRYELMYRKKETSDQEFTTYTVLVLDRNSVQLSDLTPASKYVFRVQTLTQDGHPSSTSLEYIYETLPIAEYQSQNSSMIVMGAVVGGAIMLVIVVAVLLMHKRRQNLRARQRHDDNYFTCSEKLHPLKTYVDPHTYEDPSTAVLKFTSEIHPGLITKQKVIGVGEFGEVFRGILKKPGRGSEVAVAIKTLKQGYSEKQRQDFLSEASIMGQFDHQNIIRLEGVVTKFKPAMIITEYMENGALDIYLRDHDGELSSFQLVGMLSGIAAGMKYLSDMNYVHRDLAARNVLVNSNLECKVSDFGLSRVLEDYPEGTYTTTGGKIPIRWTAPEAIAYRQFTSASDVWSFGIVMWEVMAFGERPYWEMSNQEVMKAINEAFRLPAPMDCPSAVYQLMLQCWLHDRTKRPRFIDIVNVLGKLLSNPESLKIIANFDPRVSIRLPSTSGTGGASFRTVEEWLESLKLSQYSEQFTRAGITSMEQVLHLKSEDVKNIGVQLVGHQKKIMYSILGLRDQCCTLDVFAV